MSLSIGNVTFVADLLHLTILLLLLCFHIYRIHHTSSPEPSSPSTHSTSFLTKLSLLLSLKRLSFAIILCALIRCILSLTDFIIHQFLLSHLSNSWCNIYQRTNLQFSLLASFCVHLFIAMRSRLSCMDLKNPSIWFKFGLLLISTDLVLMLFPFIQRPLWTQYRDNTCMITHINPLLLLWIVLSDIIIGTYCLLAFVLPLREHIDYEKSITSRQLGRGYPSNSMITTSGSGSTSGSVSVRNQKSIQSLVRKIMLYSTLMILSTICIMSTVWIFNITHFHSLHFHILSTFGPVHTTFTVYCIILQFSDVDTSKMKSSFCAAMVTCFQCNYCWQCDCCSNERDDVIEEGDERDSEARQSRKSGEHGKDDGMKSMDWTTEIQRNTSDTLSTFATAKSEMSGNPRSTANSETIDIKIVHRRIAESAATTSGSVSVHAGTQSDMQQIDGATDLNVPNERTNSGVIPAVKQQMKLTLNLRSQSTESGEDDPDIE